MKLKRKVEKEETLSHPSPQLFILKYYLLKIKRKKRAYLPLKPHTHTPHIVRPP
jgi:hypothetical protein